MRPASEIAFNAHGISFPQRRFSGAGLTSSLSALRGAFARGRSDAVGSRVWWPAMIVVVFHPDRCRLDPRYYSCVAHQLLNAIHPNR